MNGLPSENVDELERRCDGLAELCAELRRDLDALAKRSADKPAPKKRGILGGK